MNTMSVSEAIAIDDIDDYEHDSEPHVISLARELATFTLEVQGETGVNKTDSVFSVDTEEMNDQYRGGEAKVIRHEDLEITTDGQSLVISPASSHPEDEFRASLVRINERFAPTLKRLAE
jgi:hypothetical protein